MVICYVDITAAALPAQPIHYLQLNSKNSVLLKFYNYITLSNKALLKTQEIILIIKIAHLFSSDMLKI